MPPKLQDNVADVMRLPRVAATASKHALEGQFDGFLSLADDIRVGLDFQQGLQGQEAL